MGSGVYRLRIWTYAFKLSEPYFYYDWCNAGWAGKQHVSSTVSTFGKKCNRKQALFGDMVANSLIGGGLYSSIGLFYDKLGSYQGAFIMAAVLYIVALILGFIAIDMSRRKQKGKMVK